MYQPIVLLFVDPSHCLPCSYLIFLLLLLIPFSPSLSLLSPSPPLPPSLPSLPPLSLSPSPPLPLPPSPPLSLQLPLPSGYVPTIENESYLSSEEDDLEEEEGSDTSYLAQEIALPPGSYDPAIEIDQQTDSNHDTALTLAAAGQCVHAVH